MKEKKKIRTLSGKIDKFFGSYLSSRFPMKPAFSKVEAYKLNSSFRDISDFQRERAGRVRSNLKNNLFSFFQPIEVAIESFENDMRRRKGMKYLNSLKEAMEYISDNILSSERGTRFTRDFMLKVMPFFSTSFIPFCDICYGRRGLSLFHSEKYLQVLICDSMVMGAITSEKLENYEIEALVDVISKEHFYIQFENPFIDFVQVWMNEDTFVLCKKCVLKSGVRVRNFV